MMLWILLFGELGSAGECEWFSLGATYGEVRLYPTPLGCLTWYLDTPGDTAMVAVVEYHGVVFEIFHGNDTSLTNGTYEHETIPALMTFREPVLFRHNWEGPLTKFGFHIRYRDGTCEDGVLNGDEVDVDCGGEFCALCAFCNNSLADPGETDLDCGGECSPCADNMLCLSGEDCLSGVCTFSRCASPSCDDGVMNGGEGGVDCRGPCSDVCVHVVDVETFGFTFRAITDKLRIVNMGDTVLLPRGTYEPVGALLPLNEEHTTLGSGNLTIDGQGSTINPGESHSLFIFNARAAGTPTSMAFTLANVNVLPGSKSPAVLGNGAVINVVNCTFRGMVGGALFVADTSFTVDGCVFEDCTRVNGAALMVSVSSLSATHSVRVLRSVFRNNVAVQTGGAICVGGGVLEVRDSQFYNNTAAQRGGAIAVRGDAFFVSSVFANNNAMEGGALSFGHVKEGTPFSFLFIAALSFSKFLEKCVLTNNTASLGGGMYSEDYVVDAGSSFEGNYAEEDGGACYGEMELNCTSSRFSCNSASRGGGIFSTAAVSLNGVNMSNNTATTGGGVHVSVHLEVISSFLEENSAASGGAAFVDGNATLLHSTFRKNTASYKGGGLMLDVASVLHASHTCFEENVAIESGGALAGVTCHITLDHVAISRNSAPSGGGADVSIGTLLVRNSVVTGNVATSGGSFYLFNLKRVEVTNTLFSGGVSSLGSFLSVGCEVVITACSFNASYGTAMASTSSNVRIRSSNFSQNSANEGAALRCVSSDLNITTSRFFRNIADRNGGALWLTECATNVSSCVFSANTASAGGAVWQASKDNQWMFAQDTLFERNVATSGASTFLDGDICPSWPPSVRFRANVASYGSASAAPPARLSVDALPATLASGEMLWSQHGTRDICVKAYDACGNEIVDPSFQKYLTLHIEAAARTNNVTGDATLVWSTSSVRGPCKIFSGVAVSADREGLFAVQGAHASAALSSLEVNVTMTKCVRGVLALREGYLYPVCLCTPGSYRDEGVGTCAICPSGTFSSSEEQQTCVPCAPGSVSPPGATSCSLCPPGSFAALAGGVSCTQCVRGTVAVLAGSDRCVRCIQGFAEDGLSCQDCPLGAVCIAGFQVSQTGWWAHPSGAYLPCPGDAAYSCPGNNECGPHHDHNSPLCFGCVSSENGRYARVNGRCYKCYPRWVSLAIITVVCSIIFAFLAYKVVRQQETSGFEKPVINHLHMLALATKLAVFNGASLQVTFSWSSAATLSLRTFPVMCNVDDSYYTTLAIAATVVFTAYVLLFVSHLVAKVLGSVVWKERSLAFLVSFVTLSYPGASQTFLEAFACRADTGTLVTDPRLSCSASSTRRFHSGLALAATLVFSIGSPVFLGIGLKLYKDKLLQGLWVPLAQLTSGYHPRTFYFELFVILRKLGFVLVLVVVRDTGTQSSLGAMIMLGSLVLQLVLMPYERSSLNRVEITSICLILTTVVVGGVFQEFDDSTHFIPVAVSVLLLSAHWLFLLLLVGVILKECFPHRYVAFVARLRTLAGITAKPSVSSEVSLEERPALARIASPGRAEVGLGTGPPLPIKHPPASSSRSGTQSTRHPLLARSEAATGPGPQQGQEGEREESEEGGARGRGDGRGAVTVAAMHQHPPALPSLAGAPVPVPEGAGPVPGDGVEEALARGLSHVPHGPPVAVPPLPGGKPGMPLPQAEEEGEQEGGGSVGSGEEEGEQEGRGGGSVESGVLASSLDLLDASLSGNIPPLPPIVVPLPT